MNRVWIDKRNERRRKRRQQQEERPVLQLPLAVPAEPRIQKIEKIEEPEPRRDRGVAVVDFYI